MIFFPRENQPMKNLIRENCWRKTHRAAKTPRKEVDSQVTFRNGALDRNDLTNIYEWLWITRIANRNARHAYSNVHHISFSCDVSRRHRLAVTRFILLYSRDSSSQLSEVATLRKSGIFWNYFEQKKKKRWQNSITWHYSSLIIQKKMTKQYNMTYYSSLIIRKYFHIFVNHTYVTV